MVSYKVTLFTGNRVAAGTFNHVFIKLVGTEGESERKWLVGFKGASAFIRGAESSFTVCAPTSLGKLVLVEVDKKSLLLFPEDSWFLTKVEVKSPDGDTFTFPVHRWISDSSVHRFREATALRIIDDQHHLGRYSREQELKEREEDYRWHVYAEGIPHCIKADGPTSLPCEVQFSFTKTTEFLFTASSGLSELKLKGLDGCKKGWTNIDDIDRVFCCKQTDIADYVQEHWKEDSFFGMQFLNGVNPILIRRCTELPRNFPVTDCMVFPCGQMSLAEEIKKGNIFLCDYKHLDGVKTNTINGKKQYLMAPLVLLQKTEDKKLMPIAIQLKQAPAEDNPIFLPTDPEYDWLLAKIFVRSADFSEHQLNTHLLRTHLLAEVFAVSLLRNVPMVHPLYKLLIPHTRYTLQINFLARNLLISEKGSFTQFAASGGEGMMTILRRSLSAVTYTSLCFPDDVAERGVQDVPNYYYRDDGLRLWEITYRFVKGVIEFYYKNDEEVQQDSEIQKWISDIFKHGFLSQACTGIPQSFTSVAQLVKFVTMVIFTGSAQHAAVNSAQYDYGGWMPNTPISLKRPPPTKKGVANEDTMLETLPDVNVTVQGMATLWLLSKQSSDFVPLGNTPEQHFSEDTPCEFIKNFQAELEEQSRRIKARNKKLEVPYKYLNPEEVENSVAI
uniref:Arachidonate 15-lipoxygenase type B n=1 Tax=Oryzias melastigma TaxID=30732 RepID=A0A3B3BIJ4_ORYME